VGTVEQLEAAINDWITHRNTEPKPSTWTKTADTIIAKNRRARAILEAVKTGNQTLEGPGQSSGLCFRAELISPMGVERIGQSLDG
jgi:hypothetical protein